jgi:hypothetical protein
MTGSFVLQYLLFCLFGLSLRRAFLCCLLQERRGHVARLEQLLLQHGNLLHATNNSRLLAASHVLGWIQQRRTVRSKLQQQTV